MRKTANGDEAHGVGKLFTMVLKVNRFLLNNYSALCVRSAFAVFETALVNVDG